MEAKLELPAEEEEEEEAAERLPLPLD